jgi:uncharacterized protein (DUF427 family)
MTNPSLSSRLDVVPTAKRIRAYVGGRLLVDTTGALLVWESPYYPQYYLPRADVRTELLVPSDHTARSTSRGEARYHSIDAGARHVADAVWEYPESPIEAIRDHLRVEWSAVDHWFEEDEEVIVHPRSPYSRVDVLPSSRHVVVRIGGEVVADTHKPTLLFETGLPTRWYLPLPDVRIDLLVPSGTRTSCPYKGHASYYSVRVGDEVHEDVVWYYDTPLRESAGIAGLVCFYNEKVELEVDGRRE